MDVVLRGMFCRSGAAHQNGDVIPSRNVRRRPNFLLVAEREIAPEDKVFLRRPTPLLLLVGLFPKLLVCLAIGSTMSIYYLRDISLLP